MTIHVKDNFYVLTGAPGSGKTSVLNCLQQLGYAVVPEVARQVIKEQYAAKANALPNGDQAAFCRLSLERSLKDFTERLEESEPVFFDRGIVDTAGFSQLILQPLTNALLQAIHKYRYHAQVFIFPPWEAIYTPDDERKETFQEAVAFYRALKSAYSAFNYQLIEVPKDTPEARAQFILAQLPSGR